MLNIPPFPPRSRLPPPRRDPPPPAAVSPFLTLLIETRCRRSRLLCRQAPMLTRLTAVPSPLSNSQGERIHQIPYNIHTFNNNKNYPTNGCRLCPAQEFPSFLFSLARTVMCMCWYCFWRNCCLFPSTMPGSKRRSLQEHGTRPTGRRENSTSK